MNHIPFAFSAAFWGDCAVVCRAVDGRPGLVVQPQFGLFETWTQAYVFAVKLNQRLQFPLPETRRVTTSSLLALSAMIQENHLPDTPSTGDRLLATARAIQLDCVLAQLTLANTYCRLARSAQPSAAVTRALHLARRALDLALEFLFQQNLPGPEADWLQSEVLDLRDALRVFPELHLDIEA